MRVGLSVERRGFPFSRTYNDTTNTQGHGDHGNCEIKRTEAANILVYNGVCIFTGGTGSTLTRIDNESMPAPAIPNRDLEDNYSTVLVEEALSEDCTLESKIFDLPICNTYKLLVSMCD